MTSAEARKKTQKNMTSPKKVRLKRKDTISPKKVRRETKNSERAKKVQPPSDSKFYNIILNVFQRVTFHVVIVVEKVLILTF